MKFHLRISLLFFLVTGTLTQEFDLGDALNDLAPTPPKPKDPKKAPPKSDGDLNLFDAFGPGAPPTEKPKQPSSGGTGGFGFDLEDAVKPDPNPKPDKPAIDKPSGGGGRPFGDSDLVDVNEGDYTPDRGRSGGRASDPGYDQGGADQPQDPDLLWGKILKMIYANMPEEFYAWTSNLKQILAPLLDRVMDLLQALP
ncbi:CD99 antigen-like protein 2 isoform X3 [Parambassis ranga]|uniref:CD99 antigen-like protein 2 isoform X3 n=1 Tax=Parambassis ranga TaxID=210632 RepID=A0A6P7HSK9_9TELE|nr:CD99 antigen-like protein 2 isoform X3 [Parambassis ranga]